MIERERTQESGAPHGESAAGRFEKKLLRGGQLQVSERLQESELRSQELQELQNRRARSLSEIHDQHLPRKIFAKLPDSLAPELLQLLTPEFRNGRFARALKNSQLTSGKIPRISGTGHYHTSKEKNTLASPCSGKAYEPCRSIRSTTTPNLSRWPREAVPDS